MNAPSPSHRKYRLFVPLIALAIVALAAAVVRGLWNGVLVDVLGVKAVSYWQALGIFLLAKLLFIGFPGGRGRPFGPPWRRRLTEERWNALTPGQREEMREEMRRRFGDWPRPPWCDRDPAAPDDGAKT